MEEFRPITVDSVVLTLLNNRMLTPADFVVELQAFRLLQDRRKVFFTKFYDIPDDRRRTKVHQILLGFGKWTQYSLF